MIHKTSVIFFGSSNYCIPILEVLHREKILRAFITRPDSKPQVFALSHNIQTFEVVDKTGLMILKDQIRDMKVDIAVVADFGMIIPKTIFEIPRHKTLNIHFSKLPNLRGPSPVQYTILQGGKSAWISIVIMDEGMDTGDIIWQKEVELDGAETTDTLYKKLFNITATELPHLLSQYVQNKLIPKKQDHSKATYTNLFTRQDGFIPPRLLDCALKGLNPTDNQIKQWPLSKYLPLQFCILHFAFCIERATRALSPWPGIWTEIGITQSPDKPMKKRLKILKAHVEEKKLVLDEIQLEGKKPVSFRQFTQGYPTSSFA